LKHIKIEDKDRLDLDRYLQDMRARVWNHEPVQVGFKGTSIWQDKESGRRGYASVEIDGVLFTVGDCVVVRSTGKFLHDLGHNILDVVSDIFQNSKSRERRLTR
jgi:hypothetical protein